MSSPLMPANTDQERSINLLLERQVRAWNSGDARLYAEAFTEDATCTNILGITYFGRDAIAERTAEILATIFRGSNLKLSPRRMKFVRSDVAIVDIATEVTGYRALPPGVSAAQDGVLCTEILQVLLEEDGLWRVAAFHNTDLKGRRSTP